MPAKYPLRLDDNPATQQQATDAMNIGVLTPLQVPAKIACRLAGVSLATWWRLHSMNKLPLPNRLNGRVLWAVEGPNGLRAWVEAGCPDRETWEAQHRHKAGGR
jgi:hypothetical protein